MASSVLLFEEHEPYAVPVHLEWHEVAQSGPAGFRRRLENLAKGKHEPQKDWVRADNESLAAYAYLRWGRDIEGACAECAVAKYYGLYWAGKGTDRSAGDVGLYQVRSTSHPDGKLLVDKDRDRDDAKFVLVTGMVPDFVIRGWLYGRDAKQSRFWDSPRRNSYFCYCVPASLVNDPNTLIEW